MAHRLAPLSCRKSRPSKLGGFTATLQRSTVMRWLTIVALLMGAALLRFVIQQAHLATTWEYLMLLGWWGLAAIVLVAIAGLAFEAASWLLTFAAVPPTLRWWRRVSRVLLVGSAIELLSPLAALGGDSAKAIMLRYRYGISLGDATASLVLSRTTDIASLVLFNALGLALMLRADHLPIAVQRSAAAGLALLLLLGIIFFVAQWQHPVARAKRWIAKQAFAQSRAGRAIAGALETVADVEDRLVAFYLLHPKRLVLSTAASFAEWLSGAYLIYLALGFFGTPVTLGDAIIIESVVVLVRATLFFVPASIGTQDGAIVFMCATMTGSPSAGLALAAVHRARDLLMIAVGLSLGASSLNGARNMLSVMAESRR
jgi:glycosyltransferase 2 family protein